MEKFKFLAKDKIHRLPRNPGVYTFKKDRESLYIGKAVNLRERVKNHFQQPTYQDNLFINQVQKIGYLETDSEIEALILEADLIKKYRPKYNVIWRDDKNFFYIGITKDAFARVFITHQPSQIFASQKLRRADPKPKLEIRNSKLEIEYVGPFIEGKPLKQTLRFLRRVFPYYTAKKHQKRPCGHCHLGLCPGPNPDLKEHRKNIKNLVSVLKGERKSVLKSLKREMRLASALQNYEMAARIRDQIMALEKIFANAKIFDATQNENLSIQPRQNYQVWKTTESVLKKIFGAKKKISRIEAYDISNIQGKMAAGSMVTFINGTPDKNFYRKFRIKITGKPNDIAMIKEVLSRRFKHTEWPFPDVILIDGGKAQLNALHSEIKNQKSKIKNIKIMALAKRRNELYLENRKQPILLKTLPRPIFNIILQLRDEAHRFALTYHLKLRKKDLFK